MSQFLRGARPTPHHKLMAAPRHRVVKAPPPQFAVVPKQLSVWGNDTYGDCVSAEEAFAKAAWSVFCGLPETFATTAEVVAFARQHGFLNGADLSEVMDAMKADGMSIGGKTYTDGGYSAVNYADETELQSALTVGPVKIAIDANALPSGAGNSQGWYATGGGRYGNTDHCVGLTGYGPAGWLYQQLGVPLPAGLDANKTGYLLFTWSTIGFVDHAWLLGTCTEAWVRNPTTPGQSPAPVPPPVPPKPPAPATVTLPNLPVYIGGLHVGHAQGGTWTIDPPKAAGVNFDLFLALWQLAKDVAPMGSALSADVENFVAAIRNRSGILAAAEQLGKDVIAVGSNPAVISDVLRILTDLGVSVPADSVLAN